MEELSNEELQKKILELTELNKKLSDENTLKNSEIQNFKDKEKEYLNKIQETRDLNNKLLLQVSSQIFTDKKGEEEEQEDKEEVRPLSELLSFL